MSYPDKIKNIYLTQLAEIQHAGIFKEERFIHSSQSADIEVEFPSGSDLKKVINMCANNYLGLSSHPEVIMKGLTQEATGCLQSVSSAVHRTSTRSWREE